jgi:hypothetical protein
MDGRMVTDASSAADAGVARLEDMTVERSEASIVRIIEGSNP